MQKKLIVFDFSGTLAEEPTKNIPTLLKELKKNFGLKDEDQKEFLDLLKRSLSECRSWYALSQRVATYLRKELDGGLITLLQENIIFPLFEDIEEIANLPMKKAILTDASPFLINLNRFQKDFMIFAPQITVCRKPDSRAFQCVLDLCEAKAEESVMVGNDLYEDIVPALKMGMTPFFLDREGKIPKESIQAGIIKISSLGEIKGYLNLICP